MLKKPLVAGALLAITLLLSACESSDERAERYFQSGLELLEAGDVERALVEFRNVFKLNGQHRDARMTYARTVKDQGKLREAYGQFLLVAEQYPDDLEALRTLAEMAIEVRNWEEVERHVTRARELAPDDLVVRAISNALQYRTAVQDRDPAARRAAADEAARISADLPESLIPRRVIIDALLGEGALSEALAELDAGLAVVPDDLEFQQLRLTLLNQLGRTDEVEGQLIELATRFPESDTFKSSLISWYKSQGETGKAEAYLRSLATAEDAEDTSRVAFIQFVQQTRGIAAAKSELDQIIAGGSDTDLLTSLRAGLDFEAGDRETAIRKLEAILEDAAPGEQAHRIKLTLARMLIQMGNPVASRQRVEEVLAEDATNVEALKMQAQWLIAADRADQAIVALRGALDQAPNDAEIMSIMAQAHLRNGDRELAGELLSLAVDASDRGLVESQRYAQFLIADGKYLAAEDILVNALRAAPDDTRLLTILGDVYVRLEDWARAEQAERTLRRTGTDTSRAAADGLRLALLQRQENDEEAIAFLEGLIQRDTTNIGAEVAIIRTHFANGDLESAERQVDEALTRDPANRAMRYLKATVLAAKGDNESAAAIYRALLDEDDQDGTVWRTLYAHVARSGDLVQARSILDAAIRALPQSADLKWILASELEREDKFEEAIAVYEELYAQNSDSPILANNLASMISTYRTDEASLERAYVVARRLRGLPVPAFQDTFGWIALRRGEIDLALEHLEPAAEGLAEDPLVQYHLAVAYATANRNDDALALFERAIALAGPADSRPQFDVARSELQRLRNLPATQASDGN